MGAISTENLNLRKHLQDVQFNETSEDSRRQFRQLVLSQVPLSRSSGKRDNAEERRGRTRSRQCRSAVRLRCGGRLSKIKAPAQRRVITRLEQLFGRYGDMISTWLKSKHAPTAYTVSCWP